MTEGGSPWGRRPLPAEGAVERVPIGPLTLWLRRERDELWVAHHRAEPDGGNAAPEQPSLEQWSRWVLRDAQHEVAIVPTFPDRPLVVKPEHPFTLLRRAKARIYSRVPAWVRVQIVEKTGDGRSTLAEIPTEILSDTWWGDLREGELAYWMTTKARRRVEPRHFEPHLIICAIRLENLSTDELPVEKLSLRVEHLSIYQRRHELWGEEVVVEYQGETVGSDIRMDDRPPPEASDAVEITPARAQSRGFRARTFARLKMLSGLGG